MDSLTQLFYQHILTSLNTALYLSYSCQTLYDSNKKWAGSVLQTSVGCPATFKADVLAPGKP